MRSPAALALLLSLNACGEGGGTSTPAADPACEPLVPEQCALPWPSDHFTVADATTRTGRRLAFPAHVLPANRQGIHIDPSGYNRLDGFSPVSQAAFVFPGATLDGAATLDAPERSLAPDSPTVILDIERGTHVLHFAERDLRPEFRTAYPERALLLRPGERLRDGARLAVGIRGLRDAGGRVLPPRPSFRRGRTLPHVAVAIEALRDAGVDPDTLQLAWSFTVGSNEQRIEWLVHMRDAALAAVGAEGPEYHITSVEDDYSEHGFRRIFGTFRVPSFMEAPGYGHALDLGVDGLPVQNGFDDAPFVVVVPRGLAAAPRPAQVLHYGHGLLASAESHLGTDFGDYLQVMADRFGLVLAGTDWWGMSMEDLIYVAGPVVEDLSRFHHVTHRMHQGVVNKLLLPRLLMRRLRTEPALTLGGTALLDGSSPWYYGNSQGGIMGVTLLALSTELTRGVLGVGGMCFSCMLDRSVDFIPFAVLLHLFYPDMLDQVVALQLLQLDWDRVEGSAFAHHLRPGTLPGTQVKDVLAHVAWEDAQVPNFASWLLARTLALPMVAPVNRPVHGLSSVTAPYEGSALVDWDFEVPPNRRENVPPDEDADTHWRVRRTDASMTQVEHYLRTGTIIDVCAGPCPPR